MTETVAVWINGTAYHEQFEVLMTVSNLTEESLVELAYLVSPANVRVVFTDGEIVMGTLTDMMAPAAIEPDHDHEKRGWLYAHEYSLITAEIHHIDFISSPTQVPLND